MLSRTIKGKEDSLAGPSPDTDRVSINGDVADAAANKIAKLLPGHSKRKQKRLQQAQQAAEEDEVGRGRSFTGNTATSASLGTSDSLSTLGSTRDGEGASLMTSESEEEHDG